MTGLAPGGNPQAREHAHPPIQVSPREAARLLGIGERTLWERTKAGDIPHVRIGRLVRYRVASLER